MTASDIDSDEKIAGRTRTRTEQLGHGIGTMRYFVNIESYAYVVSQA